MSFGILSFIHDSSPSNSLWSSCGGHLLSHQIWRRTSWPHPLSMHTRKRTSCVCSIGEASDPEWILPRATILVKSKYLFIVGCLDVAWFGIPSTSRLHLFWSTFWSDLITYGPNFWENRQIVLLIFSPSCKSIVQFLICPEYVFLLLRYFPNGNQTTEGLVAECNLEACALKLRFKPVGQILP